MWLVLIEKLPQCSSWHAANKSINWNHVSAVRELRAGTRAEKDEPIHREGRTHTPASQFLDPIWQPGPHPGPSPRTGGRGGGGGLTRSNIVPGSSQEEGWGWSWRRLSGGRQPQDSPADSTASVACAPFPTRFHAKSGQNVCKITPNF